MSTSRRRFFPKKSVILRSACFITIVATLCIGSTALRSGIFRLSPLLFLASFFSEERFPLDVPDNLATLVSFGASSVIVTLCIFKRRFFCQYVCPLGLAVDVAAKGRRKFFKTSKGRFGFVYPSKSLFRLFLLLWFLVLIAPFNPIFFSFFPHGLTPFAFDPFALISRWLHERILSLSLIVFLLSFVISPFLWRFHICPCGIVQEILYLPSTLVRRFKKVRSHSHQPELKLSARRSFFTSCCAVVSFVAVGLYSRLVGGRSQALKTTIRPPGARSEIDFLTRCSRCYLCVESCPNNILRTNAVNLKQDSRRPEFFAFQLPTVDFSLGKGYCEKDCVQCSTVCPSGALIKLLPDEKARAPIARVQFTFDRCLLYYQHECSICRRECPYDAINFVWSEEEYEKLPVIDESKCVGCGRCVVFCPGQPSFNEQGEIVEEMASSQTKALEITPIQRQ